jgi:hypothetical protein
MNTNAPREWKKSNCGKFVPKNPTISDVGSKDGGYDSEQLHHRIRLVRDLGDIDLEGGIH